MTIRVVKIFFCFVFFASLFYLFVDSHSNEGATYALRIGSVNTSDDITDVLKKLEKNQWEGHSDIFFVNDSADNTCAIRVTFPDDRQDGIKWSSNQVVFDGKTGKVLFKVGWVD